MMCNGTPSTKSATGRATPPRVPKDPRLSTRPWPFGTSVAPSPLVSYRTPSFSEAIFVPSTRDLIF
jgi:hypothetical protein